VPALSEEAAPPGVGKFCLDVLFESFDVAVELFPGRDQEARLAELDPFAEERNGNAKATGFRAEASGQVRARLHHHVGQPDAIRFRTRAGMVSQSLPFGLKLILAP
jgi:hypothetical protein